MGSDTTPSQFISYGTCAMRGQPLAPAKRPAKFVQFQACARTCAHVGGQRDKTKLTNFQNQPARVSPMSGEYATKISDVSS